MVVTRCFVVMDGGLHKAVIVAVVVFVMEPGACAAGIWVEACPSNANDCVPSSDDKDLSFIVSPPPGTIGPLPVIDDV